MIEHPVFGQITYNGYWWEKSIEIEVFDQFSTVEIAIHGEEDAVFDDEQVAAYEEFFGTLPEMIKQAEQAIVDYYKTRINPGSQVTIQEVSDMVSIDEIIFPSTLIPGQREAGFLGECQWEVEHGLGIKFINGRFDNIGFQDILL